MRKMVMMMALLALAGCDAGKPEPTKTAAASASASQVSTPQWFIQMNSREAVSDLSAWLLERSYAPVVVSIDGKQQLLIGPYQSQAQAEEQLAGLRAKVTKSHRFADPAVIQRTP